MVKLTWDGDTLTTTFSGDTSANDPRCRHPSARGYFFPAFSASICPFSFFTFGAIT